MDAKLIERFESKIFYSPCGCWLWTAFYDKHGYGQFGLSDGNRKGAHRISYLIFKGEIPNGLSVCHSCDNRLCVNPDHLWLGTHQQNMEDMFKKGRHRINLSNTSIGDKVGNKYGRLRVVKFSHKIAREKFWECSCECGGSKVVRDRALRGGATKSCGCIKKGRPVKIPTIQTGPQIHQSIDYYFTSGSPIVTPRSVAGLTNSDTTRINIFLTVSSPTINLAVDSPTSDAVIVTSDPLCW